MFFFLSAFLIVTILLREKEVTGTISLRAFALRRILRIWPLYFLALIGTKILGHFFAHGFYMDSRALLEFSLLLGNLYVLQHGWVLGVVGPLWSISVEEQFYLLIPGVMRFGGKRGLIVVFTATLAVAYAVLAWLGNRGTIMTPGLFANSFVEFQFFAAGGLVAVFLYLKAVKLASAARVALGLAGLSLWLFAGIHFHLEDHVPGTPVDATVGYLLVLIGTIAIFLSVLDANLARFRALIYLGKISYGLYVYHDLFIWLLMRNDYGWRLTEFLDAHIWLGAPLALGATIATASLSYRFFESPILRFKRRFETVKTRPA